MFKKIIAKAASTLVAATVAVSGMSVFSATKASAYEYLDMSLLNIMSGDFEEFDGVLGNISEAAYDLDINVQLSDEGKEIKPFDISALLTQKDDKSAVDMDIKYDGEHLMSLNRIIDEQTGKQYIKIPELNNAYLSGSAYDMGMLSPFLGMIFTPEEDEDYKEYIDYFFDFDADEDESDVYPEYDGSDLGINGLFNILGSIDKEALMADLESYLDLLEEQLVPTETKSETMTIGDRDFVIDANAYNITGQDVQNAANAIADKLKEDSFLKDIAAQIGVDENTYIKAIDEILVEINDMRPSELAEAFKVTVYMNDGKIIGIGYDDEETESRMIMVSDGTFYGVDTLTKTEYSISTTKGSVTVDDNVVNGTVVDKSEYVDDATYSMGTTTIWENVNISDAIFKGKITTVTEEVNEDGEVSTSSEVIDSNSTNEKIDVKYVTTENGVATKSIIITGEKVEPADIIIPTENVYSLTNKDDVVAYVESADIEGFLKNLNNVLGDELFEYFIGEVVFEDPKADPTPNPAPDTSKNEVTTSKPDVEKKPAANKKPTTTVASNTTNKGGNSPETGATGVSFAVVALAGLAFIVTKKR